MSTHTITQSNWNSPSFWAAIATTGPGETLDFSGLPSNFDIDVDPDTGVITISDGATSFSVGDTSSSETTDATMGGGSQLSHFTTILGAQGSNSVDGSDSQDTLTGNDGADTIDGRDGHDVITGGAGNDVLTGGAGNDTIYGGAGHDTIDGGTGDDTLYGGDGADTFIIGDDFGSDSIEGGTSSGDQDLLDVSALSAGVTITHDPMTGGALTDGTDTLFFDEIEHLILTDQNDTADFLTYIPVTVEAGDGDDTISGSDYAGVGDTLFGQGGNDTLSGNQGNDQLYGGEDDDVLDGGRNNDTLFGGEGDDTLLAGYGSDTFYGGNGFDTLSIAGSDVSGYSFNIDLSTNSDTYGNQIYEIEAIIGGSGHDTFKGDAKNNLLDGAAGNDTLQGGAGDDTLVGGEGDDQLTGGAGNDTFVYTAGDGLDTFTDFNAGNTGALRDGDSANNDFIDLSQFYTDLRQLRDDFNDDGILNQSDGSDYSGKTAMQSGDGIVFSGANNSSFTQDNTGVVCFTDGTQIATPLGQRAIETLRVGDLVQTKDNGAQPILWIGVKHLTAADLKHSPKLRPIRLAPRLLGVETPLLVSPQHAILMRQDGQEMLVRAKHLAAMDGGQARIAAGKRQVSYFHIMCPGHEIVFANGAPAETFYPGPVALSTLDRADLEEVYGLFPELRLPKGVCAPWPTARSIARRGSLPRCLAALDSVGQKAFA